MHAAFADDIRVRIADEHVAEQATAIQAHEFPEEGGKVFEAAGVTVTAFRVNHGPLIKPAVGYRIDHAGHSVLLSGDTRPEENVIRHGTGVDLLIHEVCAAPTELASSPTAKAVIDHHTTPEQAGRIFAQAKPRLAAYTHIVLLNRPPIPTVPLAQVEAETRRAYDGPLVIGEDLTRFVVVGDGEVRVQRWDHGRQGYPG
jgi:ribonuclease Z